MSEQYQFDVIKNRLVLFLVRFLVGIFSMVSIILIVWIWPDIIHQNMLINCVLPSFFMQFIIAFLIIKNKRHIFWRKMCVTFKNDDILSIDNVDYSFNDLEYFDQFQGSNLNCGYGRFLIILKFKGHRKMVISACRTSESIKKYDEFFREINQKMASLEAKLKVTSKWLKRFIVGMQFTMILVFVWVWMNYGLASASKALPAIFTFASVSTVHLVKDKLNAKNFRKK